MDKKSFNKVLIANRGEIAVRIIRTLREMGVGSVAIYSDADEASRHVEMADEAIRLPGEASADTYLNIDAICKAVEISGADSVHPGYGFLSENSDFAEAIENMEGVTFIGPSSSSMKLLGNKIEARRLMIASGVPVVPGVEHPLSSIADLKEATERIGYPVILKAAAGGGGRGMRIVRTDEELAEAYEACTREALAYFGNADVFCERYIEHPRHIEFQTMFDKHGNGIHVFERDCSVQRRHQKLFEEAPSVYLTSEMRQKMGEIAVKAGLAADYSGAATVEFICESPEKVYFMEMNTRIQVEHPVTEMISGLDLIKTMIDVSAGNPLTLKQESLTPNGYALEARINAEDPALGFIPSPGTITKLRLPGGPYVRVDTHIYEGYKIPSSYDSMIAKLIVWAEDRTTALKRMLRALSEFVIEGVPTTIKFHEALCEQPDFVRGELTTRFLEETEDYFSSFYNAADGALSEEEAAALSAVVALLSERKLASTGKLPTRKMWTDASRRESVGEHL